MPQRLPELLGCPPTDASAAFTSPAAHRHTWRSALGLVALAGLVVGCAGPSLVPRQQADAIQQRDRALALRTEAIQGAIRQSGKLGALVFVDAGEDRLVVLPGDTPAEAWARHAAAPSESGTTRASVPAVLTFVYRADVPKAPETVTSSALERQETLRTSLTALETELRDANRRTEERLERLDSVQRDLSASIEAAEAAQLESERALAAARADVQKGLTDLADELAEARRFVLQTAQLGWLNHEMNTENASSIRRVASASQELTANSAKLAEAIRQLSETLASQLKELATRLDAVQDKISAVK